MNIQEKIAYINSLAIELSHSSAVTVKTVYNGARNTFLVYVESNKSSYAETCYMDKPAAVDVLNGMIHTLLNIRRQAGVSA